MPAKLYLQCDSPGQSQPRLQTSSPSVSGARSSSIIGAHFRHGAVPNRHSATVLELVGCASRSNRDKQADSAYEAVAIATHTRSRERLLEGLKSTAKVAIIHHHERRGKAKGNEVLRQCMSTGIGTRDHRNSSGFRGLIDSSYTTIVRRLLPVRARRQGVLC